MLLGVWNESLLASVAQVPKLRHVPVPPKMKSFSAQGINARARVVSIR